MSRLYTMHNGKIPALPEDRRLLAWVEVGQAVFINERSALSVATERQVDSEHVQLVLTVHLRGGTRLVARSPEGLAFLTTDALVRCVESDRHGPRRVLVEIGEMVTFPSLRDCAA